MSCLLLISLKMTTFIRSLSIAPMLMFGIVFGFGIFLVLLGGISYKQYDITPISFKCNLTFANGDQSQFNCSTPFFHKNVTLPISVCADSMYNECIVNLMQQRDDPYSPSTHYIRHWNIITTSLNMSFITIIVTGILIIILTIINSVQVIATLNKSTQDQKDLHIVSNSNLEDPCTKL